jgi:methylthioribose-1-phosphate isomerase
MQLTADTRKSELRTVAWTGSTVRLIDQTVLPARLEYRQYCAWRDVVEAIRTMVVRGAPAIGCTAALGMALAANQAVSSDKAGFIQEMETAADAFRGSRPTAVNLFWAVDRLLNVARRSIGHVDATRQAMVDEAVRMLDEDVAANRALGRNGSALLKSGDTVLTHCNAGALCAVGFGTALGVIRAAVEDGKDIRVVADETRPRLQGMKLTAWELHQDGIPVTIIADNMAAVLMREGKINAVIVGADRIAANGDAANKIGTYNVAVLAKYHNIPFYVAAPFSTIDMNLADGSLIPIEERDSSEMTHVGDVRISPEDVPVLNPAFDVTPNHMIEAIITEMGVIRAPYTQNLNVSKSQIIMGDSSCPT